MASKKTSSPGDRERDTANGSFLLPFRSHPSPILLLEAESLRILDCNDAAAALYLRSVEELRRLRLPALREPDSPLGADLPPRSVERHLLGDGEIRDVELEVGALDDGGERRLLVVARDVGQVRDAQRDSATENERFAVTLSSIADGVITTDLHGRVLQLNPAAETLTGWTGQDALGQPLCRVLGLAGEEALRLAHPMALVSPPNPPRFGDLVTTHIAGGAERLLEIEAAPLRENADSPAGLVLVLRDATDRQRREDERARSEKLEALAILAGGIAHDFNNLLTVVLGNLAMIEVPEDAEPEAVKEPLAHAESAILKARALTQQLLTFSRGGAPVREQASIAEIIEDAASFALRGSPVSSRVELAEDLDMVRVDTAQIHQVLNNLLINAVQAMPRGGNVRIAASNTHHAPGSLSHGRYVRVTVADDGIGIPSENLGRVFDPYFSTKSRGSGLGLATAFSIVKRHEGEITVESTPGEGTTFHVYLPSAVSSAPRSKDEVRNEDAGRGRVLVMDDEAGVRRVAAHLLEQLGYSVELARHGAEALELYRQARLGGSPFDLVILDLTVAGGMGAQEAMERLLAFDPEVCAIVTSGYVNGPVLAHYRDHGFAGVLAKPFQTQELARAVSSALRHSKPASSMA